MLCGGISRTSASPVHSFPRGTDLDLFIAGGGGGCVGGRGFFAGGGAEGSCVTVLHGGGAEVASLSALTSLHGGHGDGGVVRRRSPDDDAFESSGSCNASRSNCGVNDFKSFAKSALIMSSGLNLEDCLSGQSSS